MTIITSKQFDTVTITMTHKMTVTSSVHRFS